MINKIRLLKFFVVFCLWAIFIFPSFAGMRPPHITELFMINVDGTDLRKLTYKGSAVDENSLDVFSSEWSPDGKSIFYSNYFNAYIVDMDNKKPKRLNVTAPHWYKGISWGPQSEILFAALGPNSSAFGNSYIYKINLESNSVKKLSDFLEKPDNPYSHGSSDSSPLWSPNGKEFLYIREFPGSYGEEIHLMDADGTNDRIVAQFSSADFLAKNFRSPMTPEGLIQILKEKNNLSIPPSDSPIGSLNALLDNKELHKSMKVKSAWAEGFIKEQEQGYKLTRRDIRHLNRSLIEGSLPKEARTTSWGSYDIKEVQWSPSGDSIAVITEREINIFSRDGKLLRSIAFSEEGESFRLLRWSPDGRLLAFIGDSQIYVYDMDSTTDLAIRSNAPSYINTFTWLPDGKHILFLIRGTLYRANFSKEKYTVEDFKEITNLKLTVISMKLSPDGQKILIRL